MFCSRCGHLNADESVYCVKCGNKILTETDNSKSQPDSALETSHNENRTSSKPGEGLKERIWNSGWLSSKAEWFGIYEWVFVIVDFVLFLMGILLEWGIIITLFTVLIVLHLVNIYKRFKQKQRVQAVYEVCPQCGMALTGTVTCSKCGLKTRMPINAECYKILQNDKGVNKHNRIGVLITVAITLIMCFAIILLIFGALLTSCESSEVTIVKGGVMDRYNYGQSIGDALDNWFGGTEDWYSYSSDGKTYVICEGYTSKTLTKQSEKQQFVFWIVDEDSGRFMFENAYDVDGYPICSQTGNIGSQLDLQIANEFFGLFGYDIHQFAIEAAFGNKERLSYFE